MANIEIDLQANEANAAASRAAHLTNQAEPSKIKCRELIAELNAYRPGRIVAMPMWIDGLWRDYWYVALDGQDIGEIYYDSFGPVVKGDELGELVYKASRAAELKAERAYTCAPDDAAEHVHTDECQS